jgi:hypothetical protein
LLKISGIWLFFDHFPLNSLFIPHFYAKYSVAALTATL